MFEIVHDESVEVYLHMYNGNVQQNPLCVESCMTKEIQYSYEHTFTVVDSMRRKSYVRNCSREREGLYNGNVLLAHLSLYSSINRLYAQNPVFEVVHDESVKVYLHMYNGNVQQDPLCDKFNDWGGRGCNIFVPILGGNGTKIAPTGGIFDQSPGQIR